MKARITSAREVTRYLTALVLTASTLSTCQTNSRRDWRLYHSTDYGFTISIPRDFEVYLKGHEGRGSYLPVCDAETTIACIEYEGNEYDGTPFGAAAVSVNVLRDVTSKQLCADIDNGGLPLKTTIFNGIRFTYGGLGDGGLGHASWGQRYRSFHEGVCFEITLLTTATSMGVYDPGTMREFDSEKLDKQLGQIFHTFRFSGRVAAGREWTTYTSGCGVRFEYPAAAPVNTPIEYDAMRAESDGITCLHTFTYRGLRYNVAAKLNVQANEVDELLKSRGYSGLSGARKIQQNSYWTDYQVGPYRYIVGQAKAYILYVADAKHKVIIPHHDFVFQHFRNSFRPL